MKQVGPEGIITVEEAKGKLDTELSKLNADEASKMYEDFKTKVNTWIDDLGKNIDKAGEELKGYSDYLKSVK